MRRSATALFLLLLCACSAVHSVTAAKAQAGDAKAKVMVKQGDALAKSGDYAGAAGKYRKALGAAPDLFDALLGLGTALQMQGEWDEAIATLDEALRTRADVYEVWMQLGRAYRGQGRHDTALQHFAKAMSLGSERIEAHYEMAVTLEMMDALDDAISAYSAVLALNPSFVEAYVALGNALVKAGRTEDAAESFKTAVLHRPRDVHAHTQLGLLLADLDQHHEALHHLRKALKETPSAHLYLSIGRVHEALGETESAASMYANAVQQDSSHAEAHHALSQLTGQPSGAAAAGGSDGGGDSEFAGSHVRLAQSLKREGKLTEAVEALQRAVQLQPGLAIAYYELGQLYKELGEWEPALQYFGMALRHDETLVSCHTHIGRLLHVLGRFEEALQSYSGAVHADMQDSKAYLGMSAALMELGRYEEAIDTLSSVVVLDRNNAQAFKLMGLAYRSLGDYEKASQALLESARIANSDADAYLELAQLAVEMHGDARDTSGHDHLRDAVVHLSSAVRFDPTNAEAHVRLGEVLEMRGECSQAMRSMQEALALDPSIARAYMVLGRCLVSEGDHASALQQYAAVLVRDPNNALAYVGMGEAMLAQGNAAHALHSFIEASRLGERSLYQPFRGMGDAFVAMNKLKEAEDSFRKALQRGDPDAAARLATLQGGDGAASGANKAAENAFSRGMRALHEKRYDDAIEELYHAIGEQEVHPLAYNAIGLAMQGAGRHSKALQSFVMAIQQDPEFAEAYINMGTAFMEHGEYEEAYTSFASALSLGASDVGALLKLSELSQLRGNSDEALSYVREATREAPHNANVVFQLGRVLEARGHIDQALSEYSRAIGMGADQAGPYRAKGALLARRGDFHDAIRFLLKAVDVDANDADAHVALGRVLALRGDTLRDAEKSLAKAVAIDATHEEAVVLRGEVLGRLGRTGEAINVLARLLQSHPSNMRANALLALLQQHACDWAGFSSSVDRLATMVDVAASVSATTGESMPLTPWEAMSASLDEEVVHKVSEATAARCVAEAEADGATGVDADALFDGTHKLSVGYLASSFSQGSLGGMMAQLLALHPERTKVVVFSLASSGADNAALEAAVRKLQGAAVDVHVVPLSDLSFAGAAQRIAREAVHVLVNLDGYGAGASESIAAKIVAHGVAPVQTSLFAFMGSLGSEALSQYVVSDAISTPVEHAPAQAMPESLALLPKTFMFSDYIVEAHESVDFDGELSPERDECAAELGVPQDAVVLANFGRFNKIDADTFAAWMDVLRSHPEAVLALVNHDAIAMQSLRREAARAEVDPERLVFLPRTAGVHEHAQRLACVHLYLDTPLHNGHVSVMQALWHGVPVLTLPGTTMPTRSAAAAVAHAHADIARVLVTHSLAEYRAVAKQLVRDRAELVRMHADLVAARSGGVFSAHWVAQWERAMRVMGESAAMGSHHHIVVAE